MNRTEYAAYLRSPHWRRLRKRYQAERPWACDICEDDERLELHHKTYDRVGDGQLDDLIPLCQRCHSLLHQLVREGQASLEPTSAFDKSRAQPFVAPPHTPLRSEPRRPPKPKEPKKPRPQNEPGYISEKARRRHSRILDEYERKQAAA